MRISDHQCFTSDHQSIGSRLSNSTLQAARGQQAS
jgi:hypothetical protein